MAQKTIDIGSLTGKVLIFGGVYSNLHALQALQEVAVNEGIPASHCICTGDIIGYCAFPDESIQQFKRWGARSILGNVEIQLRDDEEDCGCDFTSGSRCDGFSLIWYAFAKANTSKNSLAFIGTLPDFIRFSYAGKNIGVIHGSADYVSEFIFQSTDWEKKLPSLKQLDVDCIIAGHCGLPFLDKRKDKQWINPGVIGMPANDRHPATWYAILDDSDGFSVSFHTLDYDHNAASVAMEKNKLPQSYADTLRSGLWDNMEILLPAERELRGKKIVI